MVEWVKRKSFEGFGYVERMGSGEFVKVCDSEAEGSNGRQRPLERWKDRVEEYLRKRGITGRGVLEQTRRKCWDREKWRLFCRGHTLGDVPGGERRKSYR